MSYSSFTRGESTAFTTATPKAGVIALVILVIHLAVEQFNAQGDAVILGEFLDAIQARDAVVDAFLIAHAAARAEQRDDVGNLGVGRADDAGAGLLFQFVVERFVVPGVVEGANALHHAGGDAVLAQDWPILGSHQVHAADAHVGRGAAQVVNRDLGVAPAGERLLQAAGRSGSGTKSSR